MTRKPADLSAMLAKKGEAKPAAPVASPAPARPKPPAPQQTAEKPIDGRSLRRTGRVQWNLKVKPETKAAALAAAQREGVTLGEIVEKALSRYLADR